MTHFIILIPKFLSCLTLVLPGMGINLDKNDYNTSSFISLQIYAIPGSFPFFHLTTRAFCFRLLLRISFPAMYAGEISQNFYVNSVSRAYRLRDAHSLRSDGNQRYTHIFFQPRRFCRWFLAGFAAPSETRNGKLRKYVVHKTENNKNRTSGSRYVSRMPNAS